MFLFLKLMILNCDFSTKLICAFLLQENIWELSEINTFKERDRLDMVVVEMRVQCCREIFQDSFETYQTFL